MISSLSLNAITSSWHVNFVLIVALNSSLSGEVGLHDWIFKTNDREAISDAFDP